MDSLLPPELRSQSTERIVSAVRSVSEALTANLLVSDLSAINRACRQLSFLIRVERAHRIEEVENLLVSVVDWLYGSIERVELQVNDQTLHKLTDLITLLLRKLYKNEKRRWIRGVSSASTNTQKLSLDWRVIYKALHKRVPRNAKGAKKHKTPNYSGKSQLTQTSLLHLANTARRFFPSTAVDEMMNEFLTFTSVHDTSIYEQQLLLCHLLPTQHSEALQKWIPKITDMWLWIENSPIWDSLWLYLFARIAKDATGEWKSILLTNDVLTVALSRFLSAIGIATAGGGPNIATAGKQSQPSNLRYWKSNAVAYSSQDKCGQVGRLLVHAITPKNGYLAFTRLEELLAQLNTFFHPANVGNTTADLSFFLGITVKSFVRRVALERELSNSSRMPEEYRLSEELIKSFALIFTPICSTSLFTRNYLMSSTASSCLKYLSTLFPMPTLNSVLHHIEGALQDPNFVHQTPIALDLLTNLLAPLLKDNSPEFPRILAALLPAAIQSIDINNIMKTAAALKFIYAVLSSLPVGYESDTVPSGDECLIARYEVNSYIADWPIQLCDRLLSYMSLCDKPSKIQSFQDRLITFLFEKVARQLFQQSSPQLRQELSTKVFTFLRSNMLNNSAKLTGALVRGIILSDASRISYLFENVESMFKSDTDDWIIWRLTIMAAGCKYAGAKLLPHKDKLMRVLDLAFSRTEVETISESTRKAIHKAAVKVLRNALFSLVNYYPLDYRQLEKSEWIAAEKNGTLAYTWGPDTLDKFVNCEWHQPTTEEISCALSLSVKYSRLAFDWCNKHIESLATTSKKTDNRSSVKFAALLLRGIVLGGAPLFLRPPSTDQQAASSVDPSIDSQDPLESYDIVKTPSIDWKPVIYRESWWSEIDNLLNDPSISESKELVISLRDTIASTLHNLIDIAFEHYPDDLRHLKYLAKLGSSLLLQASGVNKNHLEKNLHIYSFLKRNFRDFFSLMRAQCPSALFRNLRVDKIYLQHLQRVEDHNFNAVFSPSHRSLIFDLLRISQLSTDKFKEVQGQLLSAVKLNPRSSYGFYGRVIDDLVLSDRNEQFVKATISIASSRAFLTRCVRNHHLLLRLVRALGRCHIHTQHELQTRVQELFAWLIERLNASPLFITPPDVLLEKGETHRLAFAKLSDEFIRTSSNAIRRRNVENIDQYHQLIYHLYQIFTASSASAPTTSTEIATVPWRYRQMALVLLAAILRTPDRLLPPSPLALHFPHNHTLCTPPFGERVTPSQLFDSLASLTQDDIISVRTAAKCALITLLRCYKPSDRIDANIDVSAREYLDNNREILVAKAQALITNKDWLMKALEQAERDHTVLGEEDKDSQKMSRAVQQRLDALSRFVNIDLTSLMGGDSKGTTVHDVQHALRQLLDPLISFSSSRLHYSLSSIPTAPMSATDTTEHFSLLNVHVYQLILNCATRWLPQSSENSEKIISALVNACTSAIKPIEESERPLSQHTALAELLAGLARAQTPTGNQSIPSLLAHVWRHGILTRAAIESPWSAAVAFVSTNRSPSQLRTLFDCAVESLQRVSTISSAEDLQHINSDKVESTVKLAVTMLRELIAGGLKYAHELASLLFRLPANTDNGEKTTPTDFYSSLLVHPSTNVRRCVVDLLTILATLEFDPPRQNDIDNESLHEKTLLVHLNWVKALIAHQRQESTHNQTAQEDNERITRIKSTLLERVILLQSSHLAHYTLAHLLSDLLPTIFELTSDDSEDVRKLAAVSTTKLSQILVLSTERVSGKRRSVMIADIWEAVKNISNSNSWRVRAPLLTFLQVFVFNNRYLLQEQEYNELVETVIVPLLLNDAQPEVRESARRSLTSILKSTQVFRNTEREDESKPTKTVQSLIDRFLPIIKLGIPRGSAKTTAQTADLATQLRTLHGALLGLMAIIDTHPYSIPEWSRTLVLQVARHANSPPPISTAVATFLQDYWRTHQREVSGEDLMSKFTRDELDLIRQRSIPSYFA